MTSQVSTAGSSVGLSRLSPFAVAAVLAVLCAVAVLGAVGTAGAVQDDGSPTEPAVYYGNVTIDGEPAPAGTTITAMIDGEEHGSITVEEAGQYGGTGFYDGALVVSAASAQQGAPVTFLVDGTEATTDPESVTWEPAAEQQRVDLSIETDAGDGSGDDSDGGDSGGSDSGNDRSDSDGGGSDDGSDGGSDGGDDGRRSDGGGSNGASAGGSGSFGGGAGGGEEANDDTDAAGTESSTNSTDARSSASDADYDVEIVDRPDAIVPGESIEVPVEVEGTDDADRFVDVSLSLAGTELTNDTYDLGDDSSATITLEGRANESVSADDATLRLTVGDVVATIVVSGDRESESDSDSETGDSIPGFTVTAAVLATLLSIVAIRCRRER